MRIARLTRWQAERLAELLGAIGLGTSDVTTDLYIRVDRQILGTSSPDARDLELRAACRALDDRDLLLLGELLAVAVNDPKQPWCLQAAHDTIMVSYCTGADFAAWDPPQRGELLEMRERATRAGAFVAELLTASDRQRLREIGDLLRWTGQVPKVGSDVVPWRIARAGEVLELLSDDELEQYGARAEAGDVEAVREAIALARERAAADA